VPTSMSISRSSPSTKSKDWIPIFLLKHLTRLVYIDSSKGH
jgi:hypothetical protein